MREISPLAARRKGGGGPAGATRSIGRRLFTDAGVSQAENKRKRKAKLREQVKANNEWAKKQKLRRQASGRKASGRRALRAAMAEARAEGGGKLKA